MLPCEVDMFFSTARERQLILQRREFGLPFEEWTADPIFKQNNFCNVFRSDDRVSKAVRRLAFSWGEFWPAVVAGRLVNKQTTLDKLAEVKTPVSPDQLVQIIVSEGINTNAYRINTPLGLNNKNGIGLMYKNAVLLSSEILDQSSIPGCLNVMRKVKCLSGFVGYQMILDLVDMKAFPQGFNDHWTWAGPGAGRGVARILGLSLPQTWQERSSGSNRLEMTRPEIVYSTMEKLLSESSQRWNGRPWSIHEVEGWLCEYDKYRRVALGEAPGRRYKRREP